MRPNSSRSVREVAGPCTVIRLRIAGYFLPAHLQLTGTRALMATRAALRHFCQMMVATLIAGGLRPTLKLFRLGIPALQVGAHCIDFI